MMQSPNPRIYKIKRPDGQIWDIPEENLDKAISLGGHLVADSPISANQVDTPPPTDSEKIFKVRRPDGQVWDIPESNLGRAQQLGGQIVDESQTIDSEYNDIAKTTARSAKTLGAAVIGSLPDLASSVYNLPAMAENAKTPDIKANSPSHFVPESPFPEAPVYPEAQLPLIPSAEHAIEESIDEATGGYTKTHEGDSLQSGLKVAGAVFSPGGLSKLAGKVGQAGVSSVLGALGTTKPAGLAAAGATGIASQEATNAGYGVAASTAIGLGAGIGTGVGTAVAKAFNTKLALAKLTGNSPKNIDLKAVEAFEGAGLPYTNTTVNESRGLTLVDQVVSKTPFFGSRQAKKLAKNDESYTQAIELSIDKVGEKIVNSENPSSLNMGNIIKDVFDDIKDFVVNEKNELYQMSNANLPSGANWKPTNIVNTINEIRNKTKTLVASPDQTSVLSYLDKLETGIVLGGESAKVITPVPVEMLVGTKISINDIINWDINASGAKNQLRKVQHAIKQDLEDYGKTNPEWYKTFTEADAYFGEKFGDKAFGSKVVRKKILGQKNPEKILPSLNDISEFKSLEQSLSVTEKGAKFFDSIKREKLADLIMGKTINPSSESVRYSGFAKVMENPKTKELIKYLSGEQYKDLEKLNYIAKAVVKKNTRNPNPSGTAPTNLIMKVILGAFGGGTAANIGLASSLEGLGFAAVGSSGLSWLINNRSALKWGIEAAKKEASGDLKAANILSGRIERSMAKDLGEDFVKQFIALS